MDCIETDNDVATARLLTQADKIAELEKLFAKYRRKNDVFLPDDSFYKEIAGPEDAERMAASIFSWLGVKHRSITFHIDPKQDQLVVYKKVGAYSEVILGWRNQKNAFLCGASVAHGIVHHLLFARAKIDLSSVSENEELVDLGTIYAGLGIIVLNGFVKKADALGSMARANYLAECLDYFTERSIVDSIWQPYVLPGILPSGISKDIPENHLAAFVRTRTISHASSRRRFILSLIALIMLAGTLSFAYLNRPRYISAEMQDIKDSAELLKNQFKQCEETVKRKQRTWDQTDIFMLRRIEADQSRCTSIKNRYNYEVSRYNSKL